MTTNNSNHADEKVLSPADTQKGIEIHKKAATHLEAAAKSHHEAAKHYEDGNLDQANRSTIKAHGHTALATETQRENLKQQTAVK